MMGDRDFRSIVENAINSIGEMLLSVQSVQVIQIVQKKKNYNLSFRKTLQ